jgi:hypothetical protein
MRMNRKTRNILILLMNEFTSRDGLIDFLNNEVPSVSFSTIKLDRLSRVLNGQLQGLANNIHSAYSLEKE